MHQQPVTRCPNPSSVQKPVLKILITHSIPDDLIDKSGVQNTHTDFRAMVDSEFSIDLKANRLEVQGHFEARWMSNSNSVVLTCGLRHATPPLLPARNQSGPPTKAPKIHGDLLCVKQVVLTPE